MKKSIIAIILACIFALTLGLTTFAGAYTPTGNGDELMSDSCHNNVDIKTLLFSDYYPYTETIPSDEKTLLIEYPQTYWTGYSSQVEISINTNPQYERDFVYTWYGANLMDNGYEVSRWQMTGQRAQVIESYGTGFLLPAYITGSQDYVGIIDPASGGSLHVWYSVEVMWHNSGEVVYDTITQTRHIDFSAGANTFASFLPDELRNLPYEVFVLNYNVIMHIDCMDYQLRFQNTHEKPVEYLDNLSAFLDEHNIYDDFNLSVLWTPVETLLSTPLFGSFTIGGLLLIALSLMGVIAVLKLFAGG